jgi:hypothetical protein
LKLTKIKVNLAATDDSALKAVGIDDLKKFSVDANGQDGGAKGEL